MALRSIASPDCQTRFPAPLSAKLDQALLRGPARVSQGMPEGGRKLDIESNPSGRLGTIKWGPRIENPAATFFVAGIKELEQHQQHTGVIESRLLHRWVLV